ncbi:MAG TPA: ABC transporter ATP-binding protein [Acidobacteriota bacterium]|nr:ABC transporter ATP-binding protein [Acidobacteriota bacterium]
MIKLPRIPERIRHLGHLLPFLRPYRRSMLLGALMVLITNILAAASPWILKIGVDHLTQEINLNLLAFYAALILAASLAEGVFRFAMRRILIGVSRHVEYDLRNTLFHHLQQLSGDFYQKHSTGDIMARATNDLNAVRSVLGPAIMYSLNTFFTFVTVISLLLYLNWRLALLVLVPLAAVTLAVKFFGQRIHQRFEKIQEQFSDLTTMVQENLAGVRVVKAYNQEQAFIERFQQANQEYFDRNLSLVRLSGAYNPLLTLLLGLSMVLLLWYGGGKVISGVLSLGDFAAFMSYIMMLSWPVIALGWVMNIFERGAASMGRINTVLQTQPAVRDRDTRPLERIQGDIEVQGLDFAYNGAPVLHDVSFSVKAGETLAVVGRTGSGKSTLASLLCRLHPLPDGVIKVDGRDINSIPLEQLRGAIGFVPQETFLFSDTVERNIAFGSPQAGQDGIRRAAEVSNVRQDIEEFPEGFQTFVGERGITLSGGQKQRVAISRALLVDPRILILDDALSAVDTETEERILRSLGDELQGRTALLISHRISTVSRADKILVLDRGRIVERGDHEELMKLGGYYAALYEKQLLQEELEAG